MSMYHGISLDYVSTQIENIKLRLKEHFINEEVCFLFRGVGKLKYADNDVPGIFRYDDGLEKENEIITRILNEKPEYFENCHYTIERLELLQHYGLPTRLLDVTENFYVALWFACNDALKYLDSYNNNPQKYLMDGNAYVNVYALSLKNVKYNDSDTVSVLANSALMPEGFVVASDGEFLKNDIHSRKLHNEILKEKPYFLNKIKWEHMDEHVVCVKPVRKDARIRAQQGCFLLYGLAEGKKGKTFSLSEKNNQHIFKERIAISYDECKDILEDLRNLGVDKTSIFPDLEHYCENIKNGLKPVGDESVELRFASCKLKVRS